MEDFKLIPLSGKKGKGKFAIVDSEDFDKLNFYCWSISAKYYVGTKLLTGKQVLLHRFLLNVPKNVKIDHINRDPLDNRKSNLRICIQKQNARNRGKSKLVKTSSKYIGVSYNKKVKLWNANIGYEGRHINLGNYESEEYAARVRDGAAIYLYKEFAHLNLRSLEPISYMHKEVQEKHSKYNGVSFHKKLQKWQATISKDYKLLFLGYFETEIDAARRVDGENIKLYGNKAKRQISDLEPIYETPKRVWKNKSSKFIGVCKKDEKWYSSIYFNGKTKFLGNFICEIEAAKFRDDYIRKNNLNIKLNFKVDNE